MGDYSGQPHIDNDIAELKVRNNDNDIETDELLSNREKVYSKISENRFSRIYEYLFGKNCFMSDCGCFINPAIKQIERFMYVWWNELSDEARKIICTTSLETGQKIPYNWYVNSPLWKYQSSVIKMSHNYTCSICNKISNPAHIVVHHLTYEHIGSEYLHPEDVAVVCTDCHLKIHSIRRKDECER